MYHVPDLKSNIMNMGQLSTKLEEQKKEIIFFYNVELFIIFMKILCKNIE